jgi:hypothetical protein
MEQCEHIHGNGARCHAPALLRRSFCFMHWRLREHKLAVPPEPEFQLPTIDSEASVLLASNQIAAAVLSGKLDTKKARVVLACLKISIDSLRRMGDVGDVAELDLTPAMEREFAAEAQAKADVGTEKNNVNTEKYDVGAGALARAGGAKAPRSNSTKEASSRGGLQSDERSAVPTPFQQSAKALLHDLTASAPVTIEDLERVLDRHPLMTAAPV